jgi:pilin isopeptide linkage protein
MLLLALIPVSVCAAGGGQNPSSFKVSQTFNDAGGAPDDTFMYRLKPVTADCPMPGGRVPDGFTFDIKGTASVDISSISYAQTGIFKYEISQVIASEKSGYTYDRRVYTIEAYVDSDLNVILIQKNGSGYKTSDISFTNSYYMTPAPPETETPPPPPPRPPVVRPPVVTPPAIEVEDTEEDGTEDDTGAASSATPPSSSDTGEPNKNTAQPGHDAIDDNIENMATPYASLGSVLSQIMRGDVPLGGASNREDWSLISAILSVAGLVLAVRLIVKAILGRNEGRFGMSRRKTAFTFLAILFGALTPVSWVILDWPLHSMVWFNHWTPTVALIFMMYIVFAIVRKWSQRQTASQEM